VSDFREFVSALEGTTVKVTKNNINGLFQLWEEFHFRDLAAQLSQFRESGNFTENVVLLSVRKERILTLEEQMHHGKREIASLRREISRVQKSFEERIRTEPEPESLRANAVEKSVAEVRSEVDNLCKAVRKVRV
jgi:predicted  nucleic acid-binding Zn-ribbon protein